MTSLDKNKHKFNRKFINKNEDPGQIGNLFCRLLTIVIDYSALNRGKKKNNV